MNRITIGRVLSVLVAVLSLAQGATLHGASLAEQLAGHWEAEMTGDGKTFLFIFEFKVNGETLTGTVGLSTQDREFPIDGKIDGNKFSFTGFGLWKGTLEGNELNLTRELDGGKKQHMIARRTADKE